VRRPAIALLGVARTAQLIGVAEEGTKFRLGDLLEAPFAVADQVFLACDQARSIGLRIIKMAFSAG